VRIRKQILNTKYYITNCENAFRKILGSILGRAPATLISSLWFSSFSLDKHKKSTSNWWRSLPCKFALQFSAVPCNQFTTLCSQFTTPCSLKNWLWSYKSPHWIACWVIIIIASANSQINDHVTINLKFIEHSKLTNTGRTQWFNSNCVLQWGFLRRPCHKESL
jgi:hypothetical protein